MRKFLLIYSRIVLAIAVITFLLGIIFFNLKIPSITFLFVIIEIILCVRVMQTNSYDGYKGPNSFDAYFENRILAFLFILGIVSFIIGFATLLICRGGPEARYGYYYIVDHGEIKRKISFLVFRLLQLCEVFLSGGICLVFSTILCNSIPNIKKKS